eukprot:446754_1
MSLESLRDENKIKWAHLSSKLFNCDTFQRHWNETLNLKEYKFSLIQKHHLNETLNILCYQYTSFGGANDSIVFMRNVNDNYLPYKNRLNFIIEHTGLGYVILDENNHVCFVYFGNDYCDQPKNVMLANNTYSNMVEIWTAAKHQDLLYNKNIKNNKHIKYGQVFTNPCMATRPDVINKKIAFSFLIFNYMLYGMMGYKLFYTTLAHNAMIHIFKKMKKQFHGFVLIDTVYDFRNYVFKNGQTMNEFYDKLERYYKFNNVDTIKNNSKIGVSFTLYQKYNDYDFKDWTKLLWRMLQKSIQIHNRAKL